MNMSLVRIATAGAVVATVVAGCGQAAPDGEESTELVVFAAASLRDTFTELGAQFEADNPGTVVEFSFAGSSDLVAQLTQGAPGDVFASADERNMDRAEQEGLLAGDPVAFASNTLTIVVAPGNPDGVATLQDLTRPDLALVTCAPPVPCGGATATVADLAGVALEPVSEETSVTDVLNKVTTGQADAGLVYVTDAAGAGDAVTAIAFPEATEAVNVYPIATLADSANAELAQQFVDLVTGPQGQQTLADAGFAAP